MAKWIFDDFDEMGRHYHCSKCGYGIMVKENLRDWTPNKCSNCKTEMETRESRAIDAESLKDKLNDVYGDSNNLIYLYAALDLIDIQPTLTPPNEPLTLEQLREMDGEPVYIVFSPDVDGEKLQFWALVAVDEWDDVYLANKDEWAFNYEEFLEDVEAIYRRPPEGEEDT